MRIGRTLGAAAGALLLLVTVPAGTAYAAQGTFSYLSGDGELHSLQDPRNGACYDLGPAVAIQNNTAAVAEVSALPGCLSRTAVVPSDSYYRGFAGSVIFR